MTSRLGLRRLWFQAHKWIGLILMILLIPLALTGSALVWGEALDHAINPARYAVSGAPALPPSAYVAAAAKALKPGERIASLRYPEGVGPVIVSAARPGGGAQGPVARTNIWLDPGSARVLDVAGSNAGVLRWVHAFHGSLTVPGVGRQIVGWLGVAMFFSCLSGLWLWWPTMGSWARGLRWRRGRTLDHNLHHMLGFWIALPLAMLCFTGAWISFPAFFGSPPRGGDTARTRAAPAESTRRTVDDALAAVRARAKGAPATIAWPTGDHGAWRITLRTAGDTADYSMDDATGAFAKPPGAPGGGPARAMRRWHDGTGMGPIWQALIFLAGLSPAVLGVTGLLMWLRTRGWRGAAKPRRRGIEVVAAE
jgi:uncharacterized iron-regulated membrane protein